MPRILRIVNRFNLGGPTYNAAYLTKYLSPDFETLLIGGMKDETEESSEFILKNLGLNYQIIPEMKRSINPINDFAAYHKIKNSIREFQPHIVHTHAAKAGALGRQAAFSCKVPVTVHTFHGHVFHSYFGGIKTLFYKNIERKLAKKTSAISALSEKQKQELVEEHKICSSEKVHVVPLGFDLNRFHENIEMKRKNFRAKYNLSENEIAIGIVGRLVPVKNHSLFLYAIKYLKENSSKKILGFLIGDGEERNFLEEKAKELGIKENILFTSWEKNVDKIYPGLDIVCLTSFNEGTPVSLIEAQAANRPIVSTSVGGIENAVVPNNTALLSEISDEQKYFDNLLRLVDNDNLRSEMGRGGWDFVKDKFSYSRLVNDMKLLYTQLLK
ncbi:MAG: glycosyltransferase [Bacteroidetes bacterium]|nr:glycosyltransferase [Bacteroidota bacterium]